MALIHAHKKAKLVDREAVQELETKLRQDRQSCGEMALYFGSMFLWHTGRHDKAREYVDRMLKMATGNKEVKINKYISQYKMQTANWYKIQTRYKLQTVD